MDPRKLVREFGLDERLSGAGCAYCGGAPETVDHVPSKILLDDPLPDNLPVVPSCFSCNNGFSSHEEYLACFIECVVAGTTEHDRLGRAKVQGALRHSPKLAQLIEASRTKCDERIVWKPDDTRVETVVLKLARGHHLYELAAPQHEDPVTLEFLSLIHMSAEERSSFETEPLLRGWPEIGTRSFLRAAGVHPFRSSPDDWVRVQDGNYRYCVIDGYVRIVLREYLACTVVWE
ncbi:hypothetical protein ACFL2T_00370 [Elusimicrobiota bacterium]